MKTTTTKIATTYAAALKAAATQIVSVISAAVSSRLGWRGGVGVFNPGVVGQLLPSLAPSLATRRDPSATAMMHRPAIVACRGSRPTISVRRRQLAEV